VKQVVETQLAGARAPRQPARSHRNDSGSDAQLLTLIGMLYDSVLDDALWPGALQALSDFTGGTGVGQVIADPALGKITQCRTLNMDPAFEAKYLGYYAGKEVRLAPAAAFGVGAVITEDMLIDRKDLRRSEVYNDLLKPFDVPYFMFAWLQKSEHKVHTIAIEGSSAHGAFDGAAMRRFGLVVPHLIRASRMRDQFIAVRDSQRAYRSAMEDLPFGVVVLDETGRILECTGRADLLIVASNGLARRQGRVHAVNGDDDRHLQQVTGITITLTSVVSTVGRTVAVRRADGSSPLKVTVLPIASPGRLGMTARPSALMLIVDPDEAPRPHATLIRTALGLTTAEAELAHTLFSGMSLREASLLLGRSINTCKAQLKSIYCKTGSRSHVDLAKTLMMTALGERPARPPA
jgi:DNA-binding CsgD family transcriptional regulator